MSKRCLRIDAYLGQIERRKRYRENRLSETEDILPRILADEMRIYADLKKARPYSNPQPSADIEPQANRPGWRRSSQSDSFDRDVIQVTAGGVWM